VTTLRRLAGPMPVWFVTLYTTGISVLVLLSAGSHLSGWPLGTTGPASAAPYAAAAATLALAAPASVAAAAAAVLPEDAPRTAVVTNVTSLAAVELTLVAVLGAFVGALGGLMVYPALVALQHALPDLASHLPFAGVGRAWDANWVASMLLTSVAIGVWTWTCGRSRLAWFLTPDR
jgi:hypothetical protein